MCDVRILKVAEQYRLPFHETKLMMTYQWSKMINYFIKNKTFKYLRCIAK